MYNSQLQSLTEDFKKVRSSYITTTVDVRPSPLFDEVAKGLEAECVRLVPYTGNNLTTLLSADNIRRYCCTLIWMRCQHVSDEPSKAFVGYRTLYRNVEVPVFVYQLAISIGEACDSDYSIRFIPVYSIDSKEILSVDQMKEISDAFLTLRSLGFASVVGMPNERSGELGFMACCHVEEVVTSYKDSHPVYGFMASFFQQAQLNEITGLMCRIVYGYDSDYKLAVRRIISNVSAHQPRTVASD